MEQHSLPLAVDEAFDYVIKRQRRKTIAVHVLEDATVEVRAPKWVPKYELVSFIEQRSGWIISQRRQALAKQKLIPGYYHGQRHYYLGRSYPLTIVQNNRASVELQPTDTVDDQQYVLLIKVRKPNDPGQVQKALEQWYRKQAQQLFSPQVERCFALFPEWFQQQYTVPEITVRKMRRRWGSCSSKGAVTLNMLLMKMPLECIDYVIIHELCHLQEFHHGKAFYDLLASVMPHWRDAELLIEKLS